MKSFLKLKFFLKIGVFSFNIFFAGPYRKFSGEEFYKNEKNNQFNIKDENISKNISYKVFLEKISSSNKEKNIDPQEIEILKNLKTNNGFLIYLNKIENNYNYFLSENENKGENFCVGYFSDDENEIILNTLYLKILGLSDDQEKKIINSIFESTKIFTGKSLDF